MKHCSRNLSSFSSGYLLCVDNGGEMKSGKIKRNLLHFANLISPPTSGRPTFCHPTLCQPQLCHPSFCHLFVANPIICHHFSWCNMQNLCSCTTHLNHYPLTCSCLQEPKILIPIPSGDNLFKTCILKFSLSNILNNLGHIPFLTQFLYLYANTVNSDSNSIRG